MNINEIKNGEVKMVKEKTYMGEKIYICEECNFKYSEKKWAMACEDWEKKHKSCNLEVIGHAIKE